MSQPFLGQVQPFAFGFAPKGWAQCNGQLMPINQNTALFTLLGTTYGGDGRATFGLPDLRSRVPVGQGDDFTIGGTGGEETVQLALANLPQHNHNFYGSTGNADQTAPNAAGAVPANITNIRGGGQQPAARYGPNSNLMPLYSQSISLTGAGLAHTNIQPYLTINWCMAVTGTFPQRA